MYEAGELSVSGRKTSREKELFAAVEISNEGIYNSRDLFEIISPSPIISNGIFSESESVEIRISFLSFISRYRGDKIFASSLEALFRSFPADL